MYKLYIPQDNFECFTIYTTLQGYKLVGYVLNKHALLQIINYLIKLIN